LARGAKRLDDAPGGDDRRRESYLGSPSGQPRIESWFNPLIIDYPSLET